MKADVRIRHNGTGEVRTYHDEVYAHGNSRDEDIYLFVYMYTEGNYSCDCNRSLFFARAANEIADDDTDSAVSCGDSGYTCIDATLEDGTVIELDNAPALAG